MRKYLLTLLLLLAVAAVMGQKKSLLLLKSSSRIEGIKRNGVDILKVYNGIFQQDYSTLRSDSAYFYQAANVFDAFGHVNISQGDTLNIYSDKLNYNGNTKIAIMTDHVSLVDKDATLTTNYFTYNTATRFGTYTGGGKLVNKDNTLTSKNGYYFANTRDSYFRYDVRLVTPDALIVTDTLRYNSGSRIAYFYGPTNIYGKKTTKDNDTLYTENGTYNTITEQAFFGKNNLYKQGTKTLKGDSLFYDRKVGFGKAVKNIVFNDNEQKMKLKGDLATYYKDDERTVVTENAYGIILTDADTSNNAAAPKKLRLTGKDSLIKKGQLLPIDTAASNMAITAIANNKAAKPVVIAPPKNTKPLSTNKPPAFPYVNKPAVKPPAPAKSVVSANKADKSKFPYVELPDKKAKDNLLPVKQLVLKDTSRRQDTIYYTADTLVTQIITYKAFKDMLEKRRLASIRDTTAKPKAPSIVYKKAPKVLEAAKPKWVPDTVYLHRDYFGGPKPIVVATKKPAALPQAVAPVKKPTKQDSIIRKVNLKIDSVNLKTKVVLSDTSRIRILSAFHHAKIFKSDLQAISDSAFYSTSDSTIRMFTHPMIWAEGSQLSGDTIYLQMKNRKLDNLELFPAAFIVNIEKGDSVHFNQVGGKKMRGFFKNDHLNRMFVDGNAETIAFPRDSVKKEVKEMQRSLSSRIRINFKEGKLSDLTFLSKPEHRYGPVSKFTDDDKVLKAFIWKPKDRPVSKESIIPSLNKNKPVKIAAAPPAKKQVGIIKGAKDTIRLKPLNSIKAVKDSTSVLPAKTPGLSIKKDSAAIKQPAVKGGKDTAILKKPDTLKVH